MRCPRCRQPTHVVDTRLGKRGFIVRRQRECGLLKNGKLSGPSCGLKFTTMEMPVGYKAEVEIRLSPSGFETEIKKR